MLSALEVRRAAIVAAPVLAALLIVAGFFLDPATGKSGREIAAEYAAHPGREQVSALAFHFAFALLAIPAVALIVAVRGRGAWWANVAAFLAFLGAAKPPVFAPGTSYKYCNTEYNLLSLIIERATGRLWRHEISRRVLRPLGLGHTSLPYPGNRSIKGAHAHGYLVLDGRTVDRTRIDPSVAGAAGGGALVTTVQDLSRFLDALLKGKLFRRRTTLRQMLAFAPAPDVGGQVGYGLGVEKRVIPGGVQAIGHLGGAGTYTAYIGRLRPWA